MIFIEVEAKIPESLEKLGTKAQRPVGGSVKGRRPSVVGRTQVM